MKAAKLILTSIAVAIPLCLVGIFFLMGFWLSPQDNLEKSDAIVVISGGETEARTSEGIKLLKQGWAGYIVFSGAAAEDSVSNALAMKSIALKEGVSAKKIVIEEDSRNTYENAAFVKDILKAKGSKKIILITSPYHQRRANVTFRSVLGSEFSVLNHSAVDSTWRRSRWWQSPASFELTLQELYRLLYIQVTGNYA